MTLPRPGLAGYRVLDTLGRIVDEQEPIVQASGVHNAAFDASALAPWA